MPTYQKLSNKPKEGTNEGEMIYDKHFYEEAWNKWKDMKKYGPMSCHVRRLIKEVLGEISFKSVLDVGCGEGSLLKDILTDQKEIRANGADISKTALAIARGKIKKGNFYLLDIQRQALDEKFDLVICSEVLEHLEDDAQALCNIFKMTNKYLLIVTLQGKMREAEKEVGHLRNYTKGDLLEKLHKAGFKEIRIKEWGFPFYSPLYRSFLNLVPQHQKATSGKFGILRKVLSYFLYRLFMLNDLFGRGDVLVILAEAM